MPTNENFYLKLSSYLFNNLPSKLKSPLIEKIKIFKRSGLTLRIGLNETQLDNWWRHPIKILFKQKPEGLLIAQFKIQPIRWPSNVQEYAEKHAFLVNQMVERIQGLTDRHFECQKNVEVKTNFKKRYEISIIWQIKLQDVSADKSNQVFAKITDYISELSPIICQLGEGLTISANDIEENDAFEPNDKINPEHKKFLFLILASDDRFGLFGQDLEHIDKFEKHSDDEKFELITGTIEDFIHTCEDNYILEGEWYFYINNKLIPLNRQLDKEKDEILKAIENITGPSVGIACLTEKLSESIWDDEFLMLSELIQSRFTILGSHSDRDNEFVYQGYYFGEFDTGFVMDPEDVNYLINENNPRFAVYSDSTPFPDYDFLSNPQKHIITHPE